MKAARPQIDDAHRGRPAALGDWLRHQRDTHALGDEPHDDVELVDLAAALGAAFAAHEGLRRKQFGLVVAPHVARHEPAKRLAHVGGGHFARGVEALRARQD